MHRLLCLAILWLPAVLGARNGCSLSDKDCLLKSGRNKMAHFYAGNSSRNLESSDPVYEPYIKQTLPEIRYKMSNAYMRGFSSCALNSIDINEKQPFYVGYFLCPLITIEADCDITGQMGDLDVSGQGKCKMDHYNFQLGVFSNLDIYSGDDGQDHMSFTDYLLNIEVKDKVQYEFTDFWNDTEDISSTMTDFANQNWPQLYQTYQVALFEKFIHRVVVNANAYFEYIPLCDLFEILKEE